MNVLRGVRSLVLGETWTLPIAVGVLAAVALALHELVPGVWEDAGAALLVVAVPVVLVLVVRLSVPGR
jgi:hypothetical protein